MKFLTRREQMMLALVLLAFATGVGVRHYRALQGLSFPDSPGQEGRP